VSPWEKREGAESEVGRTLAGKWQLVSLIGMGGMGAVYEARHRNGRKCAIKLLHNRFADDANVTERFLREGYLANAVDHPNVVTIEDDDRDERGRAYLVMELLQGESLESWRERKGGKLPPNDVVELATQLLEVLESAHAKQIVHRDIKPANLVVGTNGQLKVLDFGVAQAIQMARESTLATKDGDVLGTPAYMPPEQALGLWDQVDARTDIWAVGATMFCLLSGQPVHKARTSNEQLARAMTVAARPLSSVAPDVPPELCEVVDKALAFERADRWQSATDMLTALSGGVPRHTLEGESSIRKLLVTQKTNRKQRSAGLVLGVAALGLVLAGTLLWVFRATSSNALSTNPPNPRSSVRPVTSGGGKTVATPSLLPSAPTEEGVTQAPPVSQPQVPVVSASTGPTPKSRVRPPRPKAPGGNHAQASGHDPLDLRE